MDLRNEPANVTDLLSGLSQPWIAEGNQANSVVQFSDMRLDDPVGHDQQYIRVFRQRVDQANGVLTEVV